MTKEHLINLTSLKKNQHAVIVAITAGHKPAKRLADMGLTPNTPIMIVRKTLFCGTIEVKVRGSNLILGKSIASKILVKKYE